MSLEQRLDEATRLALDNAWHQESAASSLERWLDLCEQQGWGRVPANQALLTQVFGASWYFTRFIFYRGPAIARLFDADLDSELEPEAIDHRIGAIDSTQPIEQALESLRVVKNEIMLQVLLADLQQLLSQSAIEHRLTRLAEATLTMALRIYSQGMASPELKEHIGILGMGRMAGDEMNFGSDLDLIFLYPGDSSDVFEQASRLIRSLLRGIAMAAPAGSLYEVDMRLRPHGAAGVLITSKAAFEDYHNDERDIWQRQLMTRSRPVVDGSGLATEALSAINDHIYARYDAESLRAEIRAMRLRVEHELGSPAGRYELKRGRGGVMDIDFISHYLQLLHGADQPDLQTPSTRLALQRLSEHDWLTAKHRDALLQGYDFLKRMESRLRVFDMKAVSSIPREASQLVILARGMGYGQDDGTAAGEALLRDYLDTTARIRGIFDEIVSEA